MAIGADVETIKNRRNYFKFYILFIKYLEDQIKLSLLPNERKTHNSLLQTKQFNSTVEYNDFETSSCYWLLNNDRLFILLVSTVYSDI